MEQIANAVKHFSLCGEVRGFIPYGNGHINDTFKVVCNDENNNDREYILQSVNNNVFKEPQKVMENIEKVTTYLRQFVEDEREVLSLIPTIDGKTYYEDENGFFWRMYDFIKDSVCIDRINSDEDFYQSAVAFGNFQRMLTDFPAETLHETIPNFHNTPSRYRDFLKAVEEDKCGRAASVKEEIEFIKAREAFYSVLLDSNKEGKLPLRVSHNDTKSTLCLTVKHASLYALLTLIPLCPVSRLLILVILSALVQIPPLRMKRIYQRYSSTFTCLRFMQRAFLRDATVSLATMKLCYSPKALR